MFYECLIDCPCCCKCVITFGHKNNKVIVLNDKKDSSIIKRRELLKSETTETDELDKFKY